MSKEAIIWSLLLYYTSFDFTSAALNREILTQPESFNRFSSYRRAPREKTSPKTQANTDDNAINSPNVLSEVKLPVYFATNYDDPKLNEVPEKFQYPKYKSKWNTKSPHKDYHVNSSPKDVINANKYQLKSTKLEKYPNDDKISNYKYKAKSLTEKIDKVIPNSILIEDNEINSEIKDSRGIETSNIASNREDYMAEGNSKNEYGSVIDDQKEETITVAKSERDKKLEESEVEYLKPLDALEERELSTKEVLVSDGFADSGKQSSSLQVVDESIQKLNVSENQVEDGEMQKSPRVFEIFSRANDELTPCQTPSGETGHCRRLTDCLLSDALSNFSLFLQYLCLMRGPFVGICCPDNPVIEVSDGDNSTNNAPIELKQPEEGCGQNSNTRIIGGTISIPHEWTWMVALMRRNRFYCGGVIINNWYILTAAHCVLGIKVKDLSVRLGEYSFLEKNEHQQDISVAEIKRHAQFVTLTFQHDIALLKLKRRIEYSKFIGSICLPERNARDFSEVNATVVGWGTVSFGGAASPVLRQVTIPVWSNEECDKTYLLESITDAFICAGSPDTGEDACQGDSGGPLMALNAENRWEVIGIVSWGRRCGDPTYPGVYTRVTTYLDWIKENTS